MISCSSGCLEVPIESCEDTDCFPFNNDLLNELLSNPESLDVLLLASENSSCELNLQQLTKQKLNWEKYIGTLRKMTSKIYVQSPMRFSLGTTSIDTEVLEGTETTNIRLGNVWYEGRDAVPDYKDPFYDIAQQAVEDPEGFWPSFGFDTTSISGLEWTITHDLESLEQVASAQNDTHSIILVLKGVPPELIGVELYGNDDSAFVLSIEKGDDVELSLKPDLPRAAIEFNVEDPVQLSDGTTIWAGYVPLGFTSEVDATELSFQVIESESTIWSLILLI